MKDLRLSACVRASPGYGTIRAGFSLLEVLVAVAILGVLMAAGFLFGLPDDSGRTANEFARLIQQARFEAIKREAPVAVVWVPADRTLEVRADVSNCVDAGTVVRSLDLDGRRVGVVTVGFVGGGLLWLPSNLARDCSGGLFPGSDPDSPTTIQGRSRTYVIDVSAAGLVVVQ